MPWERSVGLRFAVKREDARHSSSPSTGVGGWLREARRAAFTAPTPGVEQIVGRATTQSVPGGVGSCFPFTKEELSAVPDRRTAPARPLPVSERDGSETLRGGRGPDTRVG